MLPRLSLILLLGAASPAFAQEREIVVTGYGLGAGVGDEVFGGLTIERDRLANASSYRLEDVLRDVPGFQLFRRSDARSANPTSQGATLRALGGNASSRALLILDGVPQSDPFGGWVSWPAYDPRRLGAVRVVRGGGSGRNGPGALAGTIELTSAAPRELERVGGQVSYGSRNSLDLYGGALVPLDSGFLSVSGAYVRGDGFVPVVEAQRGPVDRPAAYSQGSLAVRGVAPISGTVELQANGRLFRDERERGTPFSGIRTEGADASLRIVGARWSALAYVQTRDFYNSFAAVNSGRDAASRVSEQCSVPSTGLGGRIEVRPRLGAIELRVGGDWRQVEGTTRERYQFVGGEGTRRRIAGGRTTTVGGFGEIGWSRGDLTLTGGARIDRWFIHRGFLQETAIATGESLTQVTHPERDGWEPTARAGAAWRLAPAVTVRAATYLGWRLPTLNELYRPFRVGADATAANAGLEPERLRGVEAGVDFRPAPNARIGATLFSNRLDGAIANVTLGQGPGQFPGVGFVAGQYNRRENLDAIVSRGIELDASLTLGKWSLSAGYSFADARVEASGAALPLAGLRPAQTPRHSVAASAAWRSGDGTSASLSARYVGSQYEDDLNLQLIPDALTFDAAAALPAAPGVTIELRAENIGDELVVAGISGAGIVERATPRTFWLGLRIGR